MILRRCLSYLTFAMAVYRLGTRQVIQSFWLCDFDGLAASVLGMVPKPCYVVWKVSNLVEGGNKIEKALSLVDHR
jgi:hypothetical protein